MKKKEYNQPVVDTATLLPSAHVMLTVSDGGTPPDEGPASAPRRRGEIIP